MLSYPNFNTRIIYLLKLITPILQLKVENILKWIQIKDFGIKNSENPFVHPTPQI